MADATKRFLALGSLASIVFAACTVAGDSPAPTIQPTASPQASAAPVRSLTPTIPPEAPRPSNDDPPGIDIIELPFTDTTNTSRANVGAIEMGLCGPANRTVWYSFTAAQTATMVADTFGSDFDTVVSIWRGPITLDALVQGVGMPEPLACNDDSGGRAQSELVFAATAGQTYAIQVGAAEGSSGGTLVFHLYR